MMHRFGPEIEKILRTAKTENTKISIFDDAGCMLWFCENWEGVVGNMKSWAQALGFGWLEFVHPDDMDACKKWIAAGDGAVLVARSVHPTIADRWQTFCLVKKRIGLYWVCVGDRRDVTDSSPAGISSSVLMLATLLPNLFVAHGCNRNTDTTRSLTAPA